VNIGPTELLIVLAIAILIFGGTRIPQLARSIGQAKKELRRSADEPATDNA
jgi:TatA/E family protein of Tat protein translocase